MKRTRIILILIIIVKALTNLFNLSMTNGIFPDILKHAIIKPIHKSGDKKIFSDHR